MREHVLRVSLAHHEQLTLGCGRSEREVAGQKRTELLVLRVRTRINDGPPVRRDESSLELSFHGSAQRGNVRAALQLERLTFQAAAGVR